MANTWNAITNLTLSSAQGSVTFVVSSTYRDLRLIINATTSTALGAGIVINGDATNASYSWVQAASDTGTASYSNTGTGSSNALQLAPNWNFSTTQPNLFTVEFLDYAQTDKHKIILWRGNTTATGVNALVARWANTAAISAVTLTVNGGGTWAAGSTFALYGIAG